MKRILKLTVFILVCILSLSTLCFAEDFDGYVVKLKENTAECFTDAASFSDEASLFSEMDDAEFAEFLVNEVSGVDRVAAELGFVKASDEATLDELIASGVVEYFEENIYYDLYGYDVEANAGYENQWYIDAVNADFAWNAGVFGNGVNVAVVDSGVWKNADLVPNLLDGVNYDSVSGSSCNYDSIGHGTAVAGIIAAVCNDTGSVGVAFNSKILPMRVINSAGKVSLSNAVEAINDAVNLYGCKVINLSFGSTNESKSLRSAIQDVINKGVIVVAASGNVDSYGTVPRYPAYHPEVISVANAMESGSSYVIKSTSIANEQVDIAAPGSSIYTTKNADSGHANYSGTSFACPVVSAAAALAKSVDPDITQKEFETLIKATANSTYITTSGQTSEQWGAGLLDIENMLKTMLSDEKYYVSDIHIVDDDSFFCVTNMTGAALETFSVTISKKRSDGTVKAVVLKMSLAAYETREISLSANGFTAAAKVTASLFHSPGDVNDDGKINNRDASAILGFLAGYTPNVIEEALDTNGDGKVNNRDVSVILGFLAGYDVVLH